MVKKWDLTEEAFNDLLAWLDPNRERAARRYRTIHLGLTKIFTLRGCREPEDLADETINRVARKVKEVATNYHGDPANYFFGVAKKVFLEYQRERVEFVRLPFDLAATDAGAEGEQLEFECLEHCLQLLTPAERQIVREYYGPGVKATTREKLARLLGIKSNALRVKVFRIISKLEECMDKCLKRGSPG